LGRTIYWNSGCLGLLIKKSLNDLSKDETPVSSSSSSQALDYLSLLKASQALSGEIVLSNLLERMLPIVLVGDEKRMDTGIISDTTSAGSYTSHLLILLCHFSTDEKIDLFFVSTYSENKSSKTTSLCTSSLRYSFSVRPKVVIIVKKMFFRLLAGMLEKRLILFLNFLA
jgi:hypothetical protein